MSAIKTNMVLYDKIYACDFLKSIEKVDKEITACNWVKINSKNKEILPILILDVNGLKRPFHYKEIMKTKEGVIYLQ